jgi:tagaturonate reductase
MVIIPTELILNNGSFLKEIVLKIANEHKLEASFIDWLNTENHFCDSLVDRIVPGKPNDEDLKILTDQLGYEDNLLIQSEPYALWAIQGNQKVREILSFARIDEGVVVQEDIEIHRELKLRLLNGTHTLTCGLAYLLGFRLVKDMMANSYFSKLVMNLMLSELAPSIPYKVDSKISDRFGRMVLDRFKNPFINHKLIDITVQYSAKMKMRNIPLLLQYYKVFNSAPELFCMGFAAYLNFMHGVKIENGQVYGESNGEFYPIRCDKAEFFLNEYKDFNLERILSNVELWGTDLTKLTGFSEKVTKYL